MIILQKGDVLYEKWCLYIRGFKAVWISYVIPLAILMIFLLTLQGLGFNELYAGLASALAVAVYYLVIYLFRDKIADKFVFTIAKNNI